MNQAGEALGNMAELAQLDSIVATITKQFDHDIETFAYERMPPSTEQADEWEEQRFKAQLKCYDELALKATGREPVDKTDNMTVRRRMLKRKQAARKGSLYARFTTETADLTAKASRTLRACVEELAELEAALTPTLPAKASHVTTKFAALQSRLDKIILVSFPKGWDEHEMEQPDGVELPDGEPSTWSARWSQPRRSGSWQPTPPRWRRLSQLLRSTSLRRSRPRLRAISSSWTTTVSP
jgi:hypothetical protein